MKSTTCKGQKGQFLERRGSHQKSSALQSPADDADRVEDIFFAFSKIEGDVGINCDERVLPACGPHK